MHEKKITCAAICRSCKKATSELAVEFLMKTSPRLLNKCPECQGIGTLELAISCEECESVIPLSEALWSADDEKTTCRNCRIPCDVCGEGYTSDKLLEDGSLRHWCPECLKTASKLGLTIVAYQQII